MVFTSNHTDIYSNLTPSQPERSGQMNGDISYKAATEHVTRHDLNNKTIGISSQANPSKI